MENVRTLAKLTNFWDNGKESGCNVEQLVDDDGYLTFVADVTYPYNQHYEAIYEKKEEWEAIAWVYKARGSVSQSDTSSTYTVGAVDPSSACIVGVDFVIKDAIFECFPELIHDFDADLANLLDKDGSVIETLRKTNGELEIMTFDFAEFDTRCRGVDERETKAWFEKARQKEDGELKLTAAGSALFLSEAGAELFPDIASLLSKTAEPQKQNANIERD